jgi:hypothetical protein
MKKKEQVYWKKQFDNSLKYLKKNKNNILNKTKKITSLKMSINSNKNDLKTNYKRDIKYTYENIIYLYMLGGESFNYLILDNCRKIIEFLIRIELNINPEESLNNVSGPNGKIMKKCKKWTKEQKEIANEIYKICCKPNHGQYSLLYQESKKPKYKNQLKNRKNNWQSSKEIKDIICGIDGMQKFSLSILNKIIKLANDLLK